MRNDIRAKLKRTAVDRGCKRIVNDKGNAVRVRSVGEFFKLSSLRKNGLKTLIITACEALIAAFFVFVLTFFVLQLDPVFSIVLSALAAATAGLAR